MNIIDDREAFVQAENSGRKKAMDVLNSIDLFDGDFSDYSIRPTGHTCHWDFEIVDNLTNEVIGIIEAKDRSKAGATAPACGLYLNKVMY